MTVAIARTELDTAGLRAAAGGRIIRAKRRARLLWRHTKATVLDARIVIAFPAPHGLRRWRNPTTHFQSIGSALSSRASIALDQTERSCGVSGLSDAITSAVIRRYRMSSAESLKYSGCPCTFTDPTARPAPGAPASRRLCSQGHRDN